MPRKSIIDEYNWRQMSKPAARKSRSPTYPPPPMFPPGFFSDVPPGGHEPNTTDRQFTNEMNAKLRADLKASRARSPIILNSDSDEDRPKVKVKRSTKPRKPRRKIATRPINANLSGSLKLPFPFINT